MPCPCPCSADEDVATYLAAVLLALVLPLLQPRQPTALGDRGTEPVRREHQELRSSRSGKPGERVGIPRADALRAWRADALRLWRSDSLPLRLLQVGPLDSFFIEAPAAKEPANPDDEANGRDVDDGEEAKLDAVSADDLLAAMEVCKGFLGFK